jgi:hypothetical protein
VVPHTAGAFVALLLLQPGDSEAFQLPTSPFSESDILLFAGFVLVVAAVFGLDMIRTWWETNQWRRDARRRRREMR